MTKLEERTLQEVLDKEKLPLPPLPKVEEIQFRPYVDSWGEESLEIFVLLSDQTRDEDISGENVMALKSAIHDNLLKNGIQLFPFIRIMTTADYHQL